MLVTNKLAFLFIEENVRGREKQAEKTSEFLSKELSDMEDKLRKREVEIRAFKERHMGQLPEQLDANLRILERMQEQLKTTSENIRAAEDRTVLLRGQIDQLREREQGLVARQARRESTATVEEGGSNQAADDRSLLNIISLKETSRPHSQSTQKTIRM